MAINGYSEPIRGCPFEFRVSLQDMANPGSFLANPSVGAGKVQVDIDGGGFANTATAAAVSPALGICVNVVLNAAETNGKTITVKLVDTASPKLWGDVMTSFSTKVLPVVSSGMAQAGAANTITLQSNAPAYDLTGCLVQTTGGTGGGGTGGANNQAARVTAYNTSTKVATVSDNWGTNPDATTTYNVLFTAESVVRSANVNYWSGTAVTAGAIPNAVAGAAGGLMISGTNTGPWSVSGGVSFTGTAASGATPATAGLTLTGGAASTTGGGTSAAGLASTGGAGAATTNGAAVGGSFTAGGTTTVSGNDGLLCVGSGTLGKGLHCSGRGSGLYADGSTTGAGATFSGGSTSGDGIDVNTASGDGINVNPTGGNGIALFAFGTSKHGIFAMGGSAGVCDGIHAVAGTGGVDIRGNITGNVTGSVTSVTNIVTANATQINGVNTTSVTTVNANIGTTQAITFDANNLPRSDVEDVRGTPSAGTAGYMALDWAHISASTTTVNLSGTTVGHLGNGSITATTFDNTTGLAGARNGSCQAGSTSTTIKLDPGASATDHLYDEMVVFLTSGTGAGQARRGRRDYSGTTKVMSVTPAWTTTPDLTSTFVILPFSSPWDEATADLTTSGSVGTFLANAFPPNFSSLGVTAAGKVSEVVLVDTLTTYTNDTPQSGDCFARIGANGSGLTKVALDPAAAISGTQTDGTVGAALLGLEAQAVGRWQITGTTLTLYRRDGTTVVRTFTLDSTVAPLQRS